METKTIQKYECKDPKGRNFKVHKIKREWPYIACANCGHIFVRL